MIPRSLAITIAVLLAIVLALGGYMLHLKHGAEQPARVAAEVQPITPPVTGQAVEVALFVASDDDGMLHRRATTIALPSDPSQRATAILQALVAQYLEQGSGHPLGAGAEINQVYVTNGGLAVVDANAAFADGHRSGILVEELTLASMAETLATNLPNVSRMKLLVGGAERATLAGHANLRVTYDVAAAARWVKQ